MSVFHLDIESFLTTVERIKDRGLASAPLVIAPDKERATVIAASPDAKRIGIGRDMALAHVRKHFPGVRVIPPNFKLYDTANRYVLGLVNQYSPIVEPIGYGHIALDMTGMHRLYGNMESAALKLCREVEARAFLPATVGIATNKLVSSIAAKEVQKNRAPLYRVQQGKEPAFLAPLSCKALPEWRNPFVRGLLFELNLRKIHQVQAISRDLLSFAAGALGLRLHRHALGIDPEPVTPPERTRRLVMDHCFVPDTNDDEAIRAAIHMLIERLCFQLRAKGIRADRVHFSMKYTDDVWREKLYTFGATQREETIAETLLGDYERLCDRRQRVRYLKLSFQGIYPHQPQPSLFAEPDTHKIAPHLDRIRDRFGAGAIHYGRSIKSGCGAA